MFIVFVGLFAFARTPRSLSEQSEDPACGAAGSFIEFILFLRNNGRKTMSKDFMTFQELVIALERFWAEQGCIIQQPYDLEVGAGTFNPATLLRTLGPEPWSVAYVEPKQQSKDNEQGFYDISRISYCLREILGGTRLHNPAAL
jgi:hypothetical protein